MATFINNIGYLVEMMANDSGQALLGTKFAYVGKVFIPLAFVMFVMQYCEVKTPPKIAGVLAVFHFSIIAMVFTCQSNKLFYTDISYTEEGLFPHNVYGHGIFYNIYTVLLVFYLLVILVTVIRTLVREHQKKRRIQMYYMLASAICAILGFIIFLSGISKGYDTTSISYMIATVFMTISLAKYDLLDTMELVRDYVIDNLSSGIIATDENDRIIYCNRTLKEFYPDFSTNGNNILHGLIDTYNDKEVVKINDRFYQSEYKKLLRNDKYRGHIIILSDITDSYNYSMLMKKMTEIDSLTGLFNRFAYEYHLSELKKQEFLPENLILFEMDVNGLKKVNDSLGHDAGDELIKDTAECISKAVFAYGECYRTGGDEFTAVISAENADPSKIKNAIETNAKKISESRDYEVSISVGYCALKDHKDADLEILEKNADKMMYREKENYYISKGIDRRTQNATFPEICDSYIKILKVDLATDLYEIIKMNIDEKDDKFGFSRNFSEWIRGFADSGMIYGGDLSEYTRKTNIAYLREYFQEGHKSMNIYYRRVVGNIFRKVMLEMIPAKEYSEKEPVVFLYVKDIDC